MDFSYDSPPRVAPNTPSSSAWLHAAPDEAKKRPREVPERTEAFAFGGTGSSTGSSGAFLFHQPLSPTIAGPDVEMSSETTPTRPAAPVAVVKDAKDFSAQAESSTSRPLASSGALTRVSRSRGAGGLRGAGSSEQRHSHSHTASRRKAKSAPKDDNEDDEWEADDPPKSLRRRMGDTMNIQYVFGGDAVGGNMEKRRGWSWLEPEWCLGMAQFAFNSVLLVGVLWLVYGVVRTLQRDVADKVREYELGECDGEDQRKGRRAPSDPLPVHQSSWQRSKDARTRIISTDVGQRAQCLRLRRPVPLGKSAPPRIPPSLGELAWRLRRWRRSSMVLST